ncbi:MAG: beta-1,6-N-acetylglucosaminyltransferase [Paludibacter sp.]|nr:beta-1,6-N-acetylglucosaminyltransferase [Paludibacter sp.]
MKQAILITAYKDLDFLSEIISYFDDDFYFFIHIDKKCKEDTSGLNHFNQVYVYHNYHIEWGGSNHLMAILLLIREAYKKHEYEYFHLITGSDFPVKPLSAFKDFFEKHQNENFMEYFPLPRDSWGEDGGLKRIRYYWFGLNWVDVRGRFWELIRLSLRIQKKLKINRKFRYFNGKLWAGGTYWSLSEHAIETFIRFVDENPRYIRRFRFTSIGEEIFLQTVLLNLGMPVTNNYLRYIDWGEDGANPVMLSEKDYDRVMASDCFFARKFDKIKSAKLINKIKSAGL